MKAKQLLKRRLENVNGPTLFQDASPFLSKIEPEASFSSTTSLGKRRSLTISKLSHRRRNPGCGQAFQQSALRTSQLKQILRRSWRWVPRFLRASFTALDFPQVVAFSKSSIVDLILNSHFCPERHADSENLQMASLSYVSALRLTNEALRNSDLAVKDDTLLSVLLLDLFEKITKRSQDSFESMMKHVNGALALAKIRGIKQFDNPVGLRLFLQLFSVVLIACIQCDVPVPSEILALQVASMDYTNVIEPKVRLSQALVRFIDLRVAIKNSSLRSSDAVLVAKDLDHDFELISKTMPPDFQYSTVAALPSKRVYDDHFHVYPHRRVTHIWNLNRLARILLNEIIVKRCLDVLKHEHPLSVIQEYEAQVKCSESTIASMSTEICASAPQYTFLPRFQASLPFCESGKDPTWARVWKDCNPNGIEIDNPGAASASLSSSQPRPSFWSEIHSPFECARCYSLIYPLYVAAQSFATSAPLRRWVINCLCAMSDEMGIKEASLVAGVLDRGEEIDPWSVYVMIGSYSFSA